MPKLVAAKTAIAVDLDAGSDLSDGGLPGGAVSDSSAGAGDGWEHESREDSSSGGLRIIIIIHACMFFGEGLHQTYIHKSIHIADASSRPRMTPLLRRVARRRARKLLFSSAARSVQRRVTRQRANNKKQKKIEKKQTHTYKYTVKWFKLERQGDQQIPVERLCWYCGVSIDQCFPLDTAQNVIDRYHAGDNKVKPKLLTLSAGITL